MKVGELVIKLKLLRKNDPARFTEVINKYKIQEPDLYNQLMPFFPELEKVSSGFELDISEVREESGFSWDIILIIVIVLIVAAGGYYAYTQGFFDVLLASTSDVSDSGGTTIVYSEDNGESQGPAIELIAQCYPNKVDLLVYINDGQSHSYDQYLTVRAGNTNVFDTGLSEDSPIILSQSSMISQIMEDVSLIVGVEYTVTVLLDSTPYSSVCVVQAEGS